MKFESGLKPVKYMGVTVYVPPGYCYVTTDNQGVVHAWGAQPIWCDYGWWQSYGEKVCKLGKFTDLPPNFDGSSTCGKVNWGEGEDD